MADRTRELREQIDRLKAELSGVESGVLPIIEEVGEASPAYVAARLGYSVQSANNMLVKLLRVGILDRKRKTMQGGGREFIYRVAEPETGEPGA